ncbi:hypothetical protein [Comamonas kerstersii]|uniref:hypothetical protein n=1 Tax=Comamonas kerstersii TaxID=225992 RepID=UPI0026DAA608|nr:hypothetical protein [Comamonas kerstersii]
MSEKDELCGAPAAIGMVVLALLFSGVVLAIYPGWGPIGEFLVKNLKLTEHAPAWVQAFGSIAAIFSGFGVAIYQIYSKNNEDNKSAMSSFTKVVAGIKAFKFLVERGDLQTRDIYFVRMHKALLQDQLDIARNIQFSHLKKGYTELLFGTRATLIQLIYSLEEADTDQIETQSGKILISRSSNERLHQALKVVLDKHDATINKASELIRKSKK